jgi:lathosterol oxidase
MHPKYLKNQVRLEIRQSLEAIPIMSIFTMIPFLGEVRGYGQLYDRSADAPFALYNYLQFPFFILFTDCFIYLIHRGLHHPRIYKTLHKRHHKWIMPTPFASHAFHPLDGFAQSVPYHVYPYLFPLNKVAYIALFIFINLWTVFIRKFVHPDYRFFFRPRRASILLPNTPVADDGEYVSNSPIINGAACHTMHHLYFNYNYGQFTTLWDRLGGSYRQPNVELFRRESKMSKTEWERQIRETETMVKELEGDDDRKYKGESEKKTL